MSTLRRRPRPLAASTHRRPSRTPTFVASILAALLLSSTASAQTPEELDHARSLFREGVALSAANDWTSALTKFKAVAQVKMTPQVAFNIAECEEHLGKLVSALGNYRLAASEAEAAKATDVASQVDERITALEARIPKLVIVRGEGAETARIELDGVEIGAAQVGGEMPVDPGPHVIVGKIDGQEASRDVVTMDEKGKKTVSVLIDLELLKKPKQATPGGGAVPGGPPAKDAGPNRTVAYAVTGAGVVSLGAGVLFMVMRSGTLSDLDTMCGGDTSCPPSAQATSDKGKLYTGLAEVTIPLGLVGIGAGIYLLAKGPKTEAPVSAPEGPAARARELGVKVGLAATAPGADLAGASFVGRF